MGSIIRLCSNAIDLWWDPNSITDALCTGLPASSYLQMFDLVLNQELRLCVGVFGMSPVESLYVDTHESSLGARRTMHSLQYASELKLMPTHPAHNLVFENRYVKLFDARPCKSECAQSQVCTCPNMTWDVARTQNNNNFPYITNQCANSASVWILWRVVLVLFVQLMSIPPTGSAMTVLMWAN